MVFSCGREIIADALFFEWVRGGEQKNSGRSHVGGNMADDIEGWRFIYNVMVVEVNIVLRGAFFAVEKPRSLENFMNARNS